MIMQMLIRNRRIVISIAALVLIWTCLIESIKLFHSYGSGNSSAFGIAGLIIVQIAALSFILFYEMQQNHATTDIESEIKTEETVETAISESSPVVEPLAVNKNDEFSMFFAGAKRNMQIIKKERKDIIKLKGDRFSIGGSGSNKEKVIFRNHEIKICAGDLLYLSTDGIIDQNGPDRSRFGSNRLEEILFKYSKYPLAEQEYYIRQEIERFRQNEEQRDDITLIGLKVL